MTTATNDPPTREWHAGTRCTAFKGSRRIATGELARVALKVKAEVDHDGGAAPVLVFDNATGEQVDLDLHGGASDVVKRLSPAPKQPAPTDDAQMLAEQSPRGPGRPKLGVVAREVTLLPRHWDWLNTQPGGASVALRKLVETARRENAGRDRIRRSQEATYRFMSAMAGNRPGFEEATRALFAGDGKRFARLVEPWPAAVRNYASKLAGEAFHAAE